jgi:hypothetical protein
MPVSDSQSETAPGTCIAPESEVPGGKTLTMNASIAANLVSYRAPASVWNRRGWRGVTIEERIVPTIVSGVGALLLRYGMKRRSWQRFGPTVAGATLIGCAAAGLFDPRAARVRWKHLFRQRSVDRLTNELLDSFPASDPPSVTASPDQRSRARARQLSSAEF